MIPERPAVERRILAALDAVPARIPVILGGCGSGRTSLLLRLHELVGRTASQYIDIERSASTPEQFLRAVVNASPFPAHSYLRAPAEGPSARTAFDALLAVFDSARTSGGGSATFLLDEVLELRTFESFPGLRSVLRELIGVFERSQNRFVLTTRYTSRALRLLRDASAQFEVVHLPPLTPAEVGTSLLASRAVEPALGDDIARAVHALTDGRPSYVRALGRAMAQDRRGMDPVSALATELSPDGRLAFECRYCYELRLHRARGYGALKAILHVLAHEEPLTLTEIAHQLRRTPGSTKDYLSWLEDVDLVAVRQKRYSIADPLLRLWVRLHARPVPPNDEEVAREVQRYALAKLPHPEPALVTAGGGDQGPNAPDKPWGIIEID